VWRKERRPRVWRKERRKRREEEQKVIVEKETQKEVEWMYYFILTNTVIKRQETPGHL
jgi:hypothetical protein